MTDIQDVEKLLDDTDVILDRWLVSQLEDQFGCEFRSPACLNGDVEWLWECLGTGCGFSLRACEQCKALAQQIASDDGEIETKCCGTRGLWNEISRFLPVGGAA